MATGNPLNELLALTGDEPTAIQEKYHLHRTNRNSQQKAKLLSSGFKAFSTDEVLKKLENSPDHPEYIDPRNCFVLWARPTPEVKTLAHAIQQRLSVDLPSLWLMPIDNMHITVAEITHSKTEPEIEDVVAKVFSALQKIVDYTLDHRARLVKPLLGFDASAIALSYLPAAGEVLRDGRSEQDDRYTYHHLRRDVFDMCEEAGITVQGRYVHLSAHLTIARFINELDFRTADEELDPKRVEKLVAIIESINDWLQREYWPKDQQSISEGDEWIVGEGKGLVARKGRLWYGGGTSICEGQGF